MEPTRRICGFAIALDPSRTGDRKTNDEWRAKSCETCGYPKAQSGELCEVCRGKSMMEQIERLRSLDRFLGFTGSAVHSFSHDRYLDTGDRYDRGLMDP